MAQQQGNARSNLFEDGQEMVSSAGARDREPPTWRPSSTPAALIVFKGLPGQSAQPTRLTYSPRTPAEAAMIHVSKLTKYYGDYAAIREVSFDVPKG
jgi:hypothetical protein